MKPVRDLIGRAIFRTGTWLHDLGLWLCGVAGWWDAGTDAEAPAFYRSLDRLVSRLYVHHNDGSDAPEEG